MLGIVLALPFLVASPVVQDGPPGLVLVKGGKTKIGTPVEAASKLIEEREGMKDFLVAETPLFTKELDDFFLMPTEVTNEQFAAYVEATGAKPPRSWGIEPLRAAQAQYLEEQGLARKKAREEGKPFENQVFDPDKWWADNWQSVSWEIPKGDEAKPVVFANYAEAEAYARWAGLRLMSEAEFQRAARGDSDRIYPWGDKWEEGKCLSLSNSKSEPVAVGSFPDGASNGIYDLIGNVWEWTSTPYDAFPGYEAFKVKVKGPPKREIQGLAPFDPNQRVVVGGSFGQDPIGLRIAIRKNSDRDQSTLALGFRCASSKKAGADMAAWMIDRELKLSTLPHGVELAPEFVVSRRRWESKPGTVKVDGYAVITGYQQLLLCPTTTVRASSPVDLAKKTEKDGPLFLGFLDFPRPTIEPQIDAGTYFVAWRGPAELPEVDPNVEHPWQQMPGLDATKECFLLFSSDGRPALAVPVEGSVTADKMDLGRITVDPWVAPDPKKLPRDAPPPVPMDTVHFVFALNNETSRTKGFFFDLPMKVQPGTYDSSWK